MGPIQLADFVCDFARGLKSADAKCPQWGTYQAGIGPHPETAAVALVMQELLDKYPSFVTQVRYPGESRMACNIGLDATEPLGWAIEVKMLRLLGDNGKPNDNMLMHVLSPYASDRSAITDCEKLVGSGFQCRKAILIYCFDHPSKPSVTAVRAFEALASLSVRLSERCHADFGGLIHPVQESGAVFAWEILPRL